MPGCLASLLPTVQTDKGREKDRHGILLGAESVKGTEGRISVGNRMVFYVLLGCGKRGLSKALASAATIGADACC